MSKTETQIVRLGKTSMEGQVKATKTSVLLINDYSNLW